MTTKSLRSPLGKVKGLGSAKSGTHHFMAQRLTALALIPLTIWFGFSLASLPQFDYATLTAWLQNPVSASLMIITLIATFYHAALGVQVVAEDYITAHWLRMTIIIGTNFLCMLLAVIGVVSVLKILTGGAA